ncbi:MULTISPECIES: type VII secretion system-associated protein [unclassified Streptomyces]|uniref:type VII secretion system-associated protein n=1 Tax=unclassified Streptomyces TaxID=2593676 RepID=UPI00190ADCFA|nr:MULTISPECIES: type VII secretion system-associated protein [unclassified Streptomyces]MBK3571722.1 type VII secretion system-associated protein [Streptomyces sp. MBT62]MBK6018616.1 type VII secretion system-associated protein [Streptomyces sp. MBT53]
MADLTHLDSTALKNFKNTDVADFINDLLAIRKDNAGVRSLKNLIAETGAGSAQGLAKILRIGLMNGGDSSDPVGGGTLVEALKTQATALDKILTDHKTLFDDIDDALDETITKLLKTQGDSLDSIDGEKLLDIFDTVDGDMSGSDSKT